MSPAVVPIGISLSARCILSNLYHGTMQCPPDLTSELLELIRSRSIIYCGEAGGRRSVVFTDAGLAELGVAR